MKTIKRFFENFGCLFIGIIIVLAVLYFIIYCVNQGKEVRNKGLQYIPDTTITKPDTTQRIIGITPKGEIGLKVGNAVITKGGKIKVGF